MASKGSAQRGNIKAADLINTGTTAGRLASYVLVESRNVSATSETFNFTSGAYRHFILRIRTSAGLSSGNPILLRFNGDSTSNYFSAGMGAIQGGANVFFPVAGLYTGAYLAVSGTSAGGNLGVDLTAEFCPLVVTGVRRAVFSRAFVRENSVGADNTKILPQHVMSIWEDATSAMTSATVIFGTAPTGVAELYGLPA
jgi:hypothetical protein